jgi:hypothetical protein
MMLDHVYLEYLSLSEKNDSDEMTRNITVSLISMMRVKYAYGPITLRLRSIMTLQRDS